jgi:hypothetical protein
MNTKHDNLKDRTKNFALRIIRLVEALPKGRTTDIIGTPHSALDGTSAQRIIEKAQGD